MPLRTKASPKVLTAASRAAEGRFRATFERAAIGIAHVSLQGVLLQVNAKLCEMLGRREKSLVGRNAREFSHPEDRTAVDPHLPRLLSGEIENLSLEKRYLHRTGRAVWVRLSLALVRRRNGKPDCLIAMFEEISARRAAEQARDVSRSLLEATLDSTGEGVLVTGLDRSITAWNARFLDLFGLSAESLAGRDLREVLGAVASNLSDAAATAAGLDALYEDPQREVRDEIALADGRVLERHTVPQRSAGAVIGRVCSFQDITERKRTEEKLAHLAHHDTLTGLPNRNLLRDRLPQLLSRARRNRSNVGVMLIDLDRFKLINDTLGHPVGDRLLVEVAKRLLECTRGGDTVARLGGDEFAVLLPDMPDAQKARTVAQKILDRLATPMHLDGHEVYVNASIGITVFPDDSEDQDTLIRNADVAMYSAKEQGRANYMFFSADMNRRTAQFLELESRLRQAQARDEFVLHYQPRIGVASGRITGAEALLRWRPAGSAQLVAPADFVPLLEETGMIVPVGEWVLGRAFEQVRRWQTQGLGAVPVAVNVSPRQFQRRELVPVLRRLLGDSGIAPKLIELEITETLVMMDTDYSVAAMKEINELGVPLAIDDFGTGYSSLAYLKRFVIERLKIDRSFIRDLTSDADDAAIITAVVAMAHKLGFGVVAEGVETREQIEFLRAAGCDEYQGNLFSPAVAVEQFEALFAAQSRAVAQAV